MSNPDAIRQEMERHRARRRNIEAGISLPTTKDLLRASGYMGGDLYADLHTFADIAARRVRGSSRNAGSLKTALQNLALEGLDLDDLLRVTALLKKVGNKVLGANATTAFVLRCEIYAATLGSPSAMETVFKECLDRAIDISRPAESYLYLKAALGWHRMARYRLIPSGDIVGVGQLGERVLETACLVSDAMKSQPANPVAQPKPSEQVEPKPDEPGFLTVLSEVANSDLALGKKIAAEFKAIMNRPLPLAPKVDIWKVRSTLDTEFLWASRVTDTLLTEIGNKPFVHHRPTILLGPPGVGKSRYCHRLYKLLNIPFRTFNCGGVADSTFSGTARQWASGGPSLPLTLFRSFMTASPAVVLDEIEKASTNRNNGCLFDALLAMTEPESARCWYDPYVQAPLNLSGVLWIGTANEIADIPGVLRDRFRILQFEEPAGDDLEPLAQVLMAEIVAERGMRAEWALPLSGEELDALSEVWDGGSVRALKRYLEGVLNAREAKRAVGGVN